MYIEASRLRAGAFSFVAAVFNSTIACSQLRGTPSPLTYMSARRTGAAGLPLAVAFHNHAASAAESLALLALAISSAPENTFLAATSSPSSAVRGDGFGLSAVGGAARPGCCDPIDFDLPTGGVGVVGFAAAAFCPGGVPAAFSAAFCGGLAVDCPV